MCCRLEGPGVSGPRRGVTNANLAERRRKKYRFCIVDYGQSSGLDRVAENGARDLVGVETLPTCTPPCHARCVTSQPLTLCDGGVTLDSNFDVNFGRRQCYMTV